MSNITHSGLHLKHSAVSSSPLHDYGMYQKESPHHAFDLSVPEFIPYKKVQSLTNSLKEERWLKLGEESVSTNYLSNTSLSTNSRKYSSLDEEIKSLVASSDDEGQKTQNLYKEGCKA